MHFRATCTHRDHLNKSSLLILYWRLKGKKKSEVLSQCGYLRFVFFLNPYLSEIYLQKLRTWRKSEKNTDRN